MPKNDLPNISVNAMPWALDVAVNAELRPSQLIVQRRVSGNSKRFDDLVRNQPAMHFQAWLKLEHQPRFYHWIPISRLLPGDWNARTILSLIKTMEQDYSYLRDEAISWIEKYRPELSASQTAHMSRKNQSLNLALRFVRPFDQSDQLWKLTIGEQVGVLNASYLAMKPIVDFFHNRDI